MSGKPSFIFVWKVFFFISVVSQSVTLLLSPSVQVYLSLLRMYLSPPDAHCLGPIKMELSEPQANLQAALKVLELHHSKLNTTKVRLSLATVRFQSSWNGLGACFSSY